MTLRHSMLSPKEPGGGQRTMPPARDGEEKGQIGEKISRQVGEKSGANPGQPRAG